MTAATARPAVPITLAANPWSGSRVDAAVAKLLLESEMGYRADIVEIDQDSQWPLIANGDIRSRDT